MGLNDDVDRETVARGPADCVVVITMGKRCVAAGCTLTHKGGVHLYGFPKDPALRKQWAMQVKRTRDKWEPTYHSRLCSKHFEERHIVNCQCHWGLER